MVSLMSTYSRARLETRESCAQSDIGVKYCIRVLCLSSQSRGVCRVCVGNQSFLFVCRFHRISTDSCVPHDTYTHSSQSVWFCCAQQQALRALFARRGTSRRPRRWRPNGRSCLGVSLFVSCPVCAAAPVGIRFRIHQIGPRRFVWQPHHSRSFVIAFHAVHRK